MIRQDVIDAIIKECYAQSVTKVEQIQYVLATVQHETNDTFKPVREAYWVRNKMIKKYGKKKGAAHFEAWALRNLKTSKKVYAPYYGRGFLQLTWKKNYKKFSKILTNMYGSGYIDLVKFPDLALNIDFSIKILVYGMKHGTFTGKKLDDYFNKKGSNFVKARKIINGNDKAEKIALLAQRITLV